MKNIVGYTIHWHNPQHPEYGRGMTPYRVATEAEALAEFWCSHSSEVAITSVERFEYTPEESAKILADAHRLIGNS